MAPVFVHAPLLENVTGLPEPPPSAATEKLPPNTSVAGAWSVTRIVWFDLPTVTDSVTWDAAL